LLSDSIKPADNRGAGDGAEVRKGAMRRIRYRVALSLDGYIAGPKGEFDWLVADPEMDFGARFQQFDTLLVGRRTFEFMVKHGRAAVPGMKIIVFSRTLQQRDYADVIIVAGKERETVEALRARPGKDLWLFGGGVALSQFSGSGVGGHGRGRGDPGASGRRDSVASRTR